MGLESATYIDDLVTTNPIGTDDRSTADDHLRLIKAVLKNSFSGINGEVTVSQTKINYLNDVTSDIQAQINGKLGSTATAVNSTEWAGAAQTVSTAAPSGGSDGDIWFQRET